MLGREPTRINLCFHGVGRPGRDLEPGEDRYWVSSSTLAHILDTVVGDPRVRLSFDDANASDASAGLPALLERGLTATFFVLAGRLDAPGSLSSTQVRELAAAGMTIGSHGMDHVPWRGLDPGAAQREIVGARDYLEAVVGAPVVDAALPLGRYDRRTLARVRREGYQSLHTSDRSWATADGWLQPRFSVRREDTAAGLRREVLARPPLPRRLRTTAVGMAKALR